MKQDRDIARLSPLPFGQRQVPPRACIVEDKPHVRTFLAEMLEQLGFITHQCSAADIHAALIGFFPDLLIVGPLAKAGDVPLLLRQLAAFHGKVMLFGGRGSQGLIRDHEHGEKIGLTMLPPLGTPFHDSDLRDNLRSFLPIMPSPAIPVDLDEALVNGSLELWYQPKIDPRTLTPQGAEALLRVRHPTWGVVPAAYFIPAANDPYYRALSQFVIMHVMADGLRFATAGHTVTLSTRLPMPALEDIDFIVSILRKVPEAAAQGGLLIELDCADVTADFEAVRAASAALAFRNVGIAVHEIGTEGVALAGHTDLPVVEMKADRKYVQGCGNDRVKHAVCATIVRTAHECGARAVADGVETQADFLAVRELGFDLLQGGMFAQPMRADKFERAILARGYAATA